MLEARLGPGCCYTAAARRYSGLPPLLSLLRSTLLSTSLLAAGLLVKPSLALARPPAEGSDREETIQRILELRDEAEALLETLPPETRAEVERRWRERQQEPGQIPVAPPVSPPRDEVPTPVEPPPEDLVPQPPVEESPSVAAEVSEVADTVVGDSLCGGFPLLDSDRNGLISGGDRQWRFLRLWFDNGDGRVDETEIESLFTLGVQAIDVGLRFYVNTDGDSEDVDVDEYIRLRNVGKRGQRRRIGTLVVDGDRLARDGVMALTDPGGGALTGYQPLGSDTLLLPTDGRPTPVLCLGDE
jgi:hypothetical protein